MNTSKASIPSRPSTDLEQEYASIIAEMSRYMIHKDGCESPSRVPCKCGLDPLIERMLDVRGKHSEASTAWLHSISLELVDSVLLAKAEREMGPC